MIPDRSLVRLRWGSQGPRLGYVAGGQVYDVGLGQPPRHTTLRSWLVAASGRAQAAIAELEARAAAMRPICTVAELEEPAAQPRLLCPLDSQEVWAAGVTYELSRAARMRESNQPTIYGRVYDAERPEVFFKATPHRVVGPGEAVGIRADSTWDVPEPELALVLTPALEIVGYTVGNDMSSRSIEGENPLYLPQAKVYSRCCALGPAIRLAAGFDPLKLAVTLRIVRGGALAFSGQTHTSQIHRPLAEIAAFLGRCNTFPQGLFVVTGTGIVPPDTFTLQQDDLVEIAIEGLGVLANPVTLLPVG